MMRNNILEKATRITFISLATVPLLKENYNSILIIICAIFVAIDVVKNKNYKPLTREFWIFSLLFWIFILHEVLSSDLNIKRILLHLPFVIFPLIFFYKPNYINKRVKDVSLSIFQLSVIFQSLIYFIFFISNHSITKLFLVKNNIPFFREYVSEQYFIEIHPTYFSSYLLLSFTISLFTILKNRKTGFNSLNIILSIFFIFLFSSRIIFILLFLTTLTLLFYAITKQKTKHKLIIILGVFTLIIALVFPFRSVIGDRFNEIKTEFDKPIIGDYYNSTNTRVAILKCNVLLVKKVPLFGYGDSLQDELDACYNATNDSDFYKKQVFNTHNYYFNLINYGGWLFLILFIGYIIYIFKRIKYSMLGSILLIQFLFINLTENYLSRQYGIVMFMYFTLIFIYFNNEPETIKEI